MSRTTTRPNPVRQWRRDLDGKFGNTDPETFVILAAGTRGQGHARDR
jgi:hypothetical protein